MLSRNTVPSLLITLEPDEMVRPPLSYSGLAYTQRIASANERIDQENHGIGECIIAVSCIENNFIFEFKYIIAKI